jgi:hypothetical protein
MSRGGAWTRDARVGDDAVEATEVGDGGCHRAIDRGRVTNVGLERDGTATLLLDQCDCLVELVTGAQRLWVAGDGRGQVERGNVPTPLGHRNGDRSADATRRAGDEHDATVEAVGWRGQGHCWFGHHYLSPVGVGRRPELHSVSADGASVRRRTTEGDGADGSAGPNGAPEHGTGLVVDRGLVRRLHHPDDTPAGIDVLGPGAVRGLARRQDVRDAVAPGEGAGGAQRPARHEPAGDAGRPGRAAPATSSGRGSPPASHCVAS